MKEGVTELDLLNDWHGLISHEFINITLSLEMIKIIVNTPKGGVGKTTTATNIAILLARQGLRIMAVDLAGGQLMSRALNRTPEFSIPGTPNQIVQKEGESVPDSLPGSSNFDYAVMDTDDSFVVSSDLLRGIKSGWRVLAPVNPFDAVGLDRIPREIRAILTTRALSPSELKISVFVNMAYGGSVAAGINNLQAALSSHGVESALVSTFLPYAPLESAPILLEDTAYQESLQALLQEVL